MHGKILRSTRSDLLQFHGSAKTANLVLDGIQTHQLRKSQLNEIIRRTKSVLDELSLFFVLIARDVTIFTRPSDGSVVSSSRLANLKGEG
jgi:hypothetical protein